MAVSGQTTPETAPAHLSLPPLLDTLAKLLAERRAEAYMVGGAVRDALLGRATGDIDIAVSGDARAVGRELALGLDGRMVLLDEARGMARVVIPGDLRGGPRAWHVDLSPLGDGIREDLGRRDFTIDAMAVPLADAAGGAPWRNLTDPYGGRSDLHAGVIRSVTPSVFRADPARLLRAPRLAAQLGFHIAEETVRQIRLDANLVTGVAPERVRDEVLKTLAEAGATASLRRLDDLGLLCQVIPELEQARGVTQPGEHYWDVFDHLLETAGTVEVVAQSGAGARGFVESTVPRFESMKEHFTEEVSDGHTRLTLLKLAGLLHDIAKPATRSVEASGRIRFLGHHTEGADVTARILKRLRLSGRGVELLRLAVEHHLRPSQMAQHGELPTGRAIYRYYRDLGDAAIDTIYLNLADYLAARGPCLLQEEWLEHCRITGHVLREGLERKAPGALPQIINGHDIIDAFRLPPGPRVGLLLGLVREAQANGEITTREEALSLVKANLDSGDGRA